jgi:hypothetical protein
LVHGTLVGGWYWRRVADLLEKNGQKVFSPTLTGLGERSHLLNKDINLDTHITDVVNVIKWEDLSDICLMCILTEAGSTPALSSRSAIGLLRSSGSMPTNRKTVRNPIDFTNEGFRKAFLSSMEKGEPGFPIPPPKLPAVFVNDKDRNYVDAKLTPQPVGTYAQAIRLSGAREKVAKKLTSVPRNSPIRHSTKRWRSTRPTHRGTRSKQTPTTS